MSMRFSLGQTQSQQQKQILTQRMIQAQELLQLPIQQLEQRIDAEMETNPLLEIDDGSADLESEPSETDDSPQSESDESSPGEDRREENTEDASGWEEDFRLVDEFAETYSGTIDEDPVRSQNWLEEAAQRHQDLIDNIASGGETLEEHLLDQLPWFDLSDRQKNACETIIGNIDPDGLLKVPLEELWGENADEAEKEVWKKALETVRSMDPPGVGARSVAEALLLQVTDETPHREMVRLLLERHYDDILHNRIPLIIRETGYTKEEIEEGIREIRKLNPHPGSDFNVETSPAVVPDLIVYKGEDGRWDVDINDGNQIRLGINSEYKSMLKNKETDSETKEYLRKNIGRAQWFIEALRQRKLTLLRVGQAIVQRQNSFFEDGPESLRPLKMQQIADELGIDISTVSRACSDKWLEAPTGLYSLKSFFSGAVKSDSDELSASSVKNRIKEMIDGEDKKNPLSDEEIAARLKARGADISRRTVAKYRDELKIPSSRQRKDWL
ncbi:MAG: RNA polymerase factor sigma-54 [Thermoguttaceae bacterium]|nr:RNA polymerase factor sigma-54 [Thermoguttaceae bacterium]